MTYTERSTPNTVVQDWDGAVIGPDKEQEWAAYQDWLLAGGVVNPYVPPPPPVPETISDRQFFQQAAIAGLITQAEALAAVQTGTVPAVLMNVINALPDAMQKFAAEMMLAGATQFNRHHPLTEAVGAALSWTPEQIDQFFIAAAAL